ncbi:MAG TPA: CoA transferase, partial [Candidatus Binataceae bacterium]|nr:CoA transferase [Candidatus Binataceae bacterium]
MSTTTLKHLLDGYKVLDFTQFVAGPTVTKLMAEMGAEIIKIELAPNGDLCRNFPYIKDGRSAYFVQQNRGKMSVCVDAKNPAGNAIIRSLVPQVDVLVQNYAPGVIGRMGFGYETVRELNPKIIMCSVSTFGQSGPLAPEPGYDFIGQSYAGVTSLSGEDGGDYYPPALAIGDVSTGVHAYAAVVTALLHRERTGEGQHLDISLLDSYFHYHDMAVEMVSASRGERRVERIGNQIGALSPAGLFRTRNGSLWIFAFQDNHWAALCRAMGRDELISDPRCLDNVARVANRALVNGAISEWLMRFANRDAATAALREARIPNAPVLTVEEAMNHPHLIERGTVRTVHDRIIGDFQIPGIPLRFSAFPQPLEIEAPLLGEHNRHVLKSYLGFSPMEIERLEREGVLRSAS